MLLRAMVMEIHPGEARYLVDRLLDLVERRETATPRAPEAS